MKPNNHDKIWVKNKYRTILIFATFFLVLDIGVLIANWVISSEISQGAVSINLAGRQRLLSLKMVNALLQIDLESKSPKGNDLSASLQELVLAYQRFDETLQGFRWGRMVTGGNEQPVFLKAVNSDKAKHIVKQGIALWVPYREKLQPILTAKTHVTQEMLQTAITYASEHNLKLLELMNRLTSELESLTDYKARQLQLIQTGGMVLVLLNFLVLLFHIFRKLAKNDQMLFQAHQEITALNQRIKAENLDLMAELESTNQKLTQFLEAIPVGVIVLDANGKLFYANHRVRQFLGHGVTPEATLAQLTSSYRLLKGGTDQLYPYEQLPIAQALNGQASMVDDVEIHQPGQILSVEILGTPLFDKKGHIAYAISTLQDITSRKQAEMDRKRFTVELQKLNQAYERFVPHEFLNLLDKHSILEVNLGEQVEKEMTILFSDIRGFTSLSEKMTPQQNFNFINHYLGKMEPIINQYQGFIDKYIGDAIMALFPKSADDAVRGSIAMLKTLALHNQARQQYGLSPISIGIGLNTGQLMLGTIGNQNRMDSTVISDAVNLASRVEGLTKIYHTSLLITYQTYLKLVNPLQYQIRIIDAVKVKGKSDVVTVYEVYDAQSSDNIALKNQTHDDFEQGFMLYHSQEFKDAKPFFEKVLQVNKKDKAAQVYLKRCEYFQKHGVPENWECVEMFENR